MDSTLGDREFRVLRGFLADETGIALNDFKRTLVEARLARRLRALGLSSYREYCRYLVDGPRGGEERLHFVNALTTNTTHFFRERHHFDYLQGPWASEQRARVRRASERRLQLWSAGCSTGEEAYSIAITVCESLPAAEGWELRIFASDVDTDVLRHAARAEYEEERIRKVPPAWRRRCFEVVHQPTGPRRRVVRAIRERVGFARINLCEEAWSVPADLHAIFCRNVLIYFDAATKARLVERFTSCLRPAGLLVLGHSEMLANHEGSFEQVGHTIYRKRPGRDV